MSFHAICEHFVANGVNRALATKAALMITGAGEGQSDEWFEQQIDLFLQFCVACNGDAKTILEALEKALDEPESEE